jgi:putative hydrolase of the HAD superfamily
MGKIKHLFFDLDRTIWDYENNCNEVLSDLHSIYIANKTTRLIKAEDFIRAFHIENSILWALFTENKIDKEHLRKSRFYKALLAINIDNQELADLLEEQYLSTTPLKKKLMPGVIPVLEKLSADFDLHIITNGFEEVQNFKLKNCGLHQYFKKVITSDGANARKPNREIFDWALKEAGALVNESVMVGDDFEIDIFPAEKLGWKTIFYNVHNQNKISHKENTVEINSYLEFENAILRFNS